MKVIPAKKLKISRRERRIKRHNEELRGLNKEMESAKPRGLSKLF